MRVNTHRRFTKFDAIAVVFAIAAGIQIAKYHFSSWPNPLWQYSFSALLYMGPIVASMTLMVVILRLCQPQQPLKLLASQPGTVACAAVIVVVAFRFLEFGILSIPTGSKRDAVMTVRRLVRPGYLNVPLSKIPSSPRVAFQSPTASILFGEPNLGFAVVIAWGTIIVVGCWRPEPSWIDRMGRVLGAIWIGTIPLIWFMMSLPEMHKISMRNHINSTNKT